MKKVLKIAGIVLLILIIIIAGLTIWKWDLIKSLYNGFRLAPEDIQQQMDTTQKTMQNNIEDYTGLVFRDLTEEEQSLIDSGEATKAEIFSNILNETIEEYIKQNETKEETPVSPAEPQKKTSNQIVAEYTSKLYNLKGSYIAKLDTLIGQADEEFHALPKEQWTKKTRSAIISKYITVAAGYESSCDKEVESLLNSMEKELKSINADTSVVTKMREVYYEEKSLRISHYMSQMK